MKRYFIVSYFLTTKDKGFSFGEWGGYQNDFINREKFVQNIKNENNNIFGVTIISIMEVSENDFKTYIQKNE